MYIHRVYNVLGHLRQFSRAAGQQAIGGIPWLL